MDVFYSSYMKVILKVWLDTLELYSYTQNNVWYYIFI